MTNELSNFQKEVFMDLYKTSLGAMHPIKGSYYTIEFEDGASGVIHKQKGEPIYEPLCKLTDEYKDKTFSTMSDAAVALYVSIKEYGNPKYQEKLFCYELIGQSFNNEKV